MPDVVVTVPKAVWEIWLEEGDLAGEPASGAEYEFTIPWRPSIAPGERVYVAAGGKLRGWAPLIAVRQVRYRDQWNKRPVYSLVRGGGAVACTLAVDVPSFRGFRYRWWEYDEEQEFPAWQTL